MDTKQLRDLMEAYSEVYTPEQLDESEKLNELSDRKLRAYMKKSDKSHQDLNKKWDQGTATYKDKYKSINREMGQERALKRLNKEDLDVFDIVLEYLQTEGYAETEEAASAIMVNMSEVWRESIISGEQLQELSNRKLRAYMKKSEKSHQDLNKKWDQGTASYKDKYKSINRERGQERALDILDKRSGK